MMSFFRIRQLKSKVLFLTLVLGTAWIMVLVIPNSNSLEEPSSSNSLKETKRPFIKLNSDQLVELVQKERKNHMKSICQEGNKVADPLRRNLRHIMVNDKFKVLYCYVPKVACSLWKTVFLALDNKADAKNNHDRKHFKFLDQFSEDEIGFRLHTYYKFIFVREPFERLLSGYRDKFSNNFWNWVDNPRYSREIVKNFRRQHPTSNDKVTFEKFISYVIDNKDRNEHWDTVYNLCHPCDINYDFIGHFEALQEEADQVLRITNMDKVTSFPRVESHNTSTLVQNTYSEVPPDKLVELGKEFQSDFEMFSYSFPGPLSDRMREFNEKKNHLSLP